MMENQGMLEIAFILQILRKSEDNTERLQRHNYFFKNIQKQKKTYFNMMEVCY